MHTSTRLTTLAFLAAAFAVAAAWPNTALAQLRAEDLRYYGGAHLAVPVSMPSGGKYEIGGGLSAGLSIRVADRWTFRASGSLSRSGFQNTAEGEITTRGGEDLMEGALYRRAASLSVQRFFSEDDDLRFYLISGVGWDRYETDFFGEAETTADALRGTNRLNTRTESAVSLEAGAGLLAPLSYTAALFIEPRYRLSFTTGDQTHFVPLTVGLVFGEF